MIIDYIDEGPFPIGLLPTVGDRKGDLREGTAGAQQRRQTGLRYEGPQEKVHPGKEPGKKYHDRKKHTQRTQSPIPRQAQGELPR